MDDILDMQNIIQSNSKGLNRQNELFVSCTDSMTPTTRATRPST
jgi:hypothetical protein